MKVLFVIIPLLCCSIVYNMKLKVKNINMDLSELEDGFGNSARFAEEIFSDSKYNNNK